MLRGGLWDSLEGWGDPDGGDSDRQHRLGGLSQGSGWVLRRDDETSSSHSPELGKVG